MILSLTDTFLTVPPETASRASICAFESVSDELLELPDELVVLPAAAVIEDFAAMPENC